VVRIISYICQKLYEFRVIRVGGYRDLENGVISIDVTRVRGCGLRVRVVSVKGYDLEGLGL